MGELDAVMQVAGVGAQLSSLDPSDPWAVVGQALDGYTRLRRFRMEAWWKHVRENEDEEVFAKRLREGMTEDQVRVVAEGVRAAMEAVHESFVPPLARLSRRYLGGASIAPVRFDRIFRGYVDAFRSLDGRDYDELTTIARWLQTVLSERPEIAKANVFRSTELGTFRIREEPDPEVFLPNMDGRYGLSVLTRNGVLTDEDVFGGVGFSITKEQARDLAYYLVGWR